MRKHVRINDFLCNRASQKKFGRGWAHLDASSMQHSLARIRGILAARLLGRATRSIHGSLGRDSALPRTHLLSDSIPE